MWSRQHLFQKYLVSYDFCYLGVELSLTKYDLHLRLTELVRNKGIVVLIDTIPCEISNSIF